MDRVKSILLGAVIGLPILAGLLYMLNSFGEMSWLYGWIGLTVISFALQFVAPRWIMPLFNKFTPLEDGELKDAIFDYAAKVEYSLKHLFVMDGSKRSAKSNAFFTGFGKNKRIALFDTLIEKHTTGELVSILAHEIGHFKKKHIIKSMLISVLHTGILFYIMSLFLNHKPLFEAFFVENIGLHTGLIFFSMLFSPVENVLSVIMNVFSRKNEYEADRYAVETTGKQDDMINALKKLSEHNLSNLTPHKFFVFMNYSHPPVLERIRAIRSIG
jgi:STE24 endopeptidase